MIDLGSPVETVLGEPKDKKGRTRNERIVEGLGIETVGDLLHHFPRRYVETGELTALESLEKGQFLTLVGEIATSRVNSYTDRRTRRQAYRLDATLRTDGPTLRMSFFAKNKGVADWQAGRLRAGRRGIFLGQADTFRGEWQLTNPQMVLFGTSRGGARRTPPSSAWSRSARSTRSTRSPAASSPGTSSARSPSPARSSRRSPTCCPTPVREQYDVLPVRQALDWVHQPDTWGQIKRAQHRYRFEEALVTQLVLGRRRRAVRAMGARPRDGGEGDLLAAFDAKLPFTLTKGQQEVGAQIEEDLLQPHPMNRLLQGEVGSGKTLVALRAMLRVVDSGGQAALLAPTEVLAQQHHRSITAMLGELAEGGMMGGTNVELLTGSMTKAQRTEPLSRLAIGEAGIVIGTHALLEEQVQFFDLGLVVVDEQHRFGVEQRAALTDKAGTPPHVLVMTATPIPRTVAMTVFGDLETSTLAELPAGRAPIQTNVVPLDDQPQWISRVWARVREEVEKGHQAYVVCPRITGDELEQGEADPAYDDEPEDAGRPPPRAATGLTAVARPGRGAAEGGAARRGSGSRSCTASSRPRRRSAPCAPSPPATIDVLVATTVIEVGVDVANATTMVLMDAERFGISQLHQLRGRVGRGGLPGLCLLVSRAEVGSPARDRLDAVAGTTDGFELSRVDLEQRREGDVLGRSQSGFRSTLQNLRVLRDEETILEAREAAEALLDADADLAQHPLLRAEVVALEESAQGEFIEKS